MLAGRECLEEQIRGNASHISISSTYLPTDLRLIGQGEQLGDNSAETGRRRRLRMRQWTIRHQKLTSGTYREVTPFSANLEKPKPPCIIQRGSLVGRVVVGAKALESTINLRVQSQRIANTPVLWSRLRRPGIVKHNSEQSRENFGAFKMSWFVPFGCT